MKNTGLIIFIFFTSLSGLIQAQSPVLDSTVVITQGQQVQIQVINNAMAISPGNAGPSQVYDYSTLPTFNSNYTITGVDNSISPYVASYPQANATVSWSSFGTPFYHFILTGTSYTYLGGGTSFGDFNYTDAYDQLRFPFTYNDTYQDSFAAVSNTGSHRLGSVKVTADGYGTLMTPGNTILDVIRIKRESDYYDTINGNPRHSIETYYEYYKPGIPHYLLLHGFYTITTGASTVNGSQLFYNNSIVTGIVAKLQQPEISIIKVAGESYIQLKNATFYSTILSVYNTQGQLAATQNITINDSNNNILLDHFNLSNGIYIIQLQSAKGDDIRIKWSNLKD